MQEIIDKIYSIVWSDALVYLCLLAGVYFSIRFKLPQLIYLKEMVRLLFKGGSSKKGISSFQAFSLAISGRVGTGNIAGVATAIGMGGPGAIFWMWVIAFLGSSSAIIEATLGQLYKEEKDGQYRGGPAYYIQKGLKSKLFAWVFAIVTIISTGFLLPSVQSNSIAVAMKSAFNFSPGIVGLFLVLLLGFIIIGGVKRISKVAEFVVPFMAGAYILMAVVIIVLNIQQVPAIFKLIFQSALNLEATFGGIVGSAISWGVKRGIYSNEAGQGTAPHAAAAAEVSHPIKQGLVQGFSVYVDTLFVCTATALMILFTGQYNVVHPAGGFIVQHIPGIEAGPEFTQMAVSQHFPNIGSGFIAIALMFFAFTTIMAYYYIAECNVSFLGKKRSRLAMIWVLRAMILGSVYFGCISTAKMAWDLGDIGVGMMAWLNMIAIILLHNKVLKLFKDYNQQRKEGKDPVFNNQETKFSDVEIWEKK
ncbi:alanine/glycine:cation symporter family protein [Sphingobacterium cellulitidis]|uniref:Sodium:alanine symporter n=1 Tax=Sphingobacterium cellulitidis TaxID=1768011 RepID=A0A8H9FYN0_9SPHI|nr:alanine/glycine:cation symporter family protein [Sphingobacterium soli]MBA8987082.1 AGCS family alanine or glycine:cation symporter [Sphingobacterium soli]GGE16243.1 sodium:alanine symporter [Sphingobacterium soli]